MTSSHQHYCSCSALLVLLSLVLPVQNENGDVWALDSLQAVLGPAGWRHVWQQIQISTALVFAAALARAQEVRMCVCG